MTWAVVPVKRFERAKSRLAAALSPRERRELARAMLGDVLDALAGVRGLQGVLVVTREPEARDMAAALGFESLTDESEAGVNAAVSLGLDRLALRRVAALIAPGDIPCLSAAEVGLILDALGTAQVVVAPAARDGGTNALALARADLLTPCFGPDSARRHVALARTLGHAPTVLQLPGAGRDIDVPADLEALAPRGAPRTRACLAGIDSARRSQSLALYERTTP
jgi:2-phospho-L-lactate/phosphoenolpyruvate guanylyltransferase